MREPIELLRTSEIFGGLDERALALLAACAEPKTYPAGAELFREGEPCETCYVVVEGRLALSRRGPRREQRLILLGPGEAAGESALLQVPAHGATARAVGRLEVLALSRDRVLAALAEDGAAAVAVLGAVARLIARHLRFSASGAVGFAKAYTSGATRHEHDLLGDREVPADALYGIQTLRGVENFPLTGVPLSHFPALVRALAAVKQAAARANLRLGHLPAPIADAIDRACQEIIDGHWHGHFVVDMVQGGAGTSTNMNANEVIANRALELLGHARGEYAACHPNNHVNLAQSTNDVYPTALRIAALHLLRDLLAALERLRGALAAKGEEFADVLKMGRTQLQDAVPMTLGQEFTAFAVTTGEDIDRLRDTARLLLEINMGGTAIGTGILADPRYSQLVAEELRAITGLDLVIAGNLVEATPDTGAFVLFSGALKRAAIKLSKMCNDLRLLSSGPRAGLNEINLPPMQPGSSIMPGKVNPVIPEVVNQVAFAVIGHDLTITLAAEAAQLQLNVMEPILAYSLFQSLATLTAAVEVLRERCIEGITANAARTREMVERSIGIVTALVPVLGYERASEVATEALTTGAPVREIVLARGLLDAAELDELLAPAAMTRPRRLPS
ncbi:MAG: aspartate ammonia-lyase [Thermoanaerobaculaceae bacterium]|nr:aspartate ammonia-lyase [Thermoanaerobaculaceae bacterium]MDI9622757.1 aspartate ammonia-lyase [Acidobacteriota bacterium]HPW56988.1 aspartate ammonia-lyase [Thermoanaerobaculaceae bacterium]